MIKDSKEHLISVNETYIQHLKAAFTIGTIMIIGGLQALLHGICPAKLQKSASDKIRKLYFIVSERTD